VQGKLSGDRRNERGKYRGGIYLGVKRVCREDVQEICLAPAANAGMF